MKDRKKRTHLCRQNRVLHSWKRPEGGVPHIPPFRRVADAVLVFVVILLLLFSFFFWGNSRLISQSSLHLCKWNTVFYKETAM